MENVTGHSVMQYRTESMLGITLEEASNSSKAPLYVPIKAESLQHQEKGTVPQSCPS